MTHPYATAAYAGTLRHIGRPVPVPAWGTHALIRDVPGRPDMVDAAGPYPLTAMRPDADVAGGLAALRAGGAISAVLVADPLGGPGPDALARHFPLCRPFKTHHLVDRDAGPVVFSDHHRAGVRRGARRAEFARVDLSEPRWMAAWTALYAGLVARRGVTGPAAFPAASFGALAALPDLVTFAALSPAGEALAMQLWLRRGDRADGLLTAASEAGYRAGANYVLYAAAIGALSDCRVLDLGGVPGAGDDVGNGLARFKSGFANRQVVAHLCGAVLDRPAYARLSGGSRAAFFPAYRTPAARHADRVPEAA